MRVRGSPLASALVLTVASNSTRATEPVVPPTLSSVPAKQGTADKDLAADGALYQVIIRPSDAYTGGSPPVPGA